MKSILIWWDRVTGRAELKRQLATCIDAVATQNQRHDEAARILQREERASLDRVQYGAYPSAVDILRYLVRKAPRNENGIIQVHAAMEHAIEQRLKRPVADVRWSRHQ